MDLLTQHLKPVRAEHGRPLYTCVCDALRVAIDAGLFPPGQRMPSTKQLSEQMKVSLVTAHRALTELVASGILSRSQGRGTYVHAHYRQRIHASATLRVALVPGAGISLADNRQSRILEAVRQSAHQLLTDLVLLRFDEDVRNECDGFLLVGTTPQEINAFVARTRRKPIVAAGVCSRNSRASCVFDDKSAAVAQALDHLIGMGHRRIGFVGPEFTPTIGGDCCSAFTAACDARRLPQHDQHILKSLGLQLDGPEQSALLRMLSVADRPTAICAAGFHLALAVYRIATEAGLRLPQDLSVISLGNSPPSADLLAPSLTAFRLPLDQIGRTAMEMLHRQIRINGQAVTEHESLKPQLVVRGSIAAPRL